MGRALLGSVFLPPPRGGNGRIAILKKNNIILTRRESKDEPPNYILRGLKDNSLNPVTEFKHPYPQMKNLYKVFVLLEMCQPELNAAYSQLLGSKESYVRYRYFEFEKRGMFFYNGKSNYIF